MTNEQSALLKMVSLEKSPWALEFPPSIRKVCLEYTHQHMVLWHPSRKRINSRHVLYQFKWFFEFVLERRSVLAYPLV